MYRTVPLRPPWQWFVQLGSVPKYVGDSHLVAIGQDVLEEDQDADRTVHLLEYYSW